MGVGVRRSRFHVRPFVDVDLGRDLVARVVARRQLEFPDVLVRPVVGVRITQEGRKARRTRLRFEDGVVDEDPDLLGGEGPARRRPVDGRIEKRPARTGHRRRRRIAEKQSHAPRGSVHADHGRALVVGKDRGFRRVRGDRGDLESRRRRFAPRERVRPGDGGRSFAPACERVQVVGDGPKIGSRRRRRHFEVVVDAIFPCHHGNRDVAELRVDVGARDGRGNDDERLSACVGRRRADRRLRGQGEAHLGEPVAHCQVAAAERRVAHHEQRRRRVDEELRALGGGRCLGGAEDRVRAGTTCRHEGKLDGRQVAALLRAHDTGDVELEPRRRRAARDRDASELDGQCIWLVVERRTELVEDVVAQKARHDRDRSGRAVLAEHAELCVLYGTRERREVEPKVRFTVEPSGRLFHLERRCGAEVLASEAAIAHEGVGHWRHRRGQRVGHDLGGGRKLPRVMLFRCTATAACEAGHEQHQPCETSTARRGGGLSRTGSPDIGHGCLPAANCGKKTHVSKPGRKRPHGGRTSPERLVSSS